MIFSITQEAVTFHKGPKVGPFGSHFDPFLITMVCQIDYKAIKMVEKKLVVSPNSFYQHNDPN